MRILFWNINKFSHERVIDPDAWQIIFGAVQATTPDIIVIVEVTAPTGAEIPIDGSLPDWEGIKIPNGLRGLLTLVTSLNIWAGGPAWRLVPPLHLGGGDPHPGRRELVGVIFNQKLLNNIPQLIFTGPWQLCAEDIKFDFSYQSNPTSYFRRSDFRIRAYIPSGQNTPYIHHYDPNMQAQDYNYALTSPNNTQFATLQRRRLSNPDPLQFTNGFNHIANSLQDCLVPAGAYNVQEHTTYLGGQYFYSRRENDGRLNLIGFPAERRMLVPPQYLDNGIEFSDPNDKITMFDVSMLSFSPGSRAPYLVTFWDAANQRNIKLLALHTSPDSSSDAVNALAYMQEIAHLAPNEICIIAGDFNVDTFQNDAVYATLTGNQYQFAFGLNPLGLNGLDFTRRPRCLTHMLTVDASTPFTTPGLHGRATDSPGIFLLDDPTDSPGGPAPSLGYMGAMGGPIFQTATYSGCIDNFLWRTNINGLNLVTYIVNPVSGKIYNPANDLAGAQYQSALATQGLPAGVNRAVVNSALLALQFRETKNFGKIRRASDHLPILLEIT